MLNYLTLSINDQEIQKKVNNRLASQFKSIYLYCTIAAVSTFIYHLVSYVKNNAPLI